MLLTGLVSIACLGVLLGITKFLSRVEKHFLKSQLEPTRYAVRWSLSFFKIGRFAILVIASMEASLAQHFTFVGLGIGIAAIVIGLSLRCMAISSLGSLWSYNCSVTKNHYVVRSGIYRRIKHPAYIGNIQLPGLVLAIGSPISAAMAFVLIVVFYLIRTKAETCLLNGLREKCRA